MDFKEDPKFREVAEQMNEPCGTDKIKNVLDNADDAWLNKCGRVFVRNAISIIYNRHFYIEGSSFTGGRVTFNQIKDGEVGRLFINMAYVLMALKYKDGFIYVSANKYPKPTFDIFIEY